MASVVYLATGDGLVTLDHAGAELGRDFVGQEVASVAARDDCVVAALPGSGVYRRTAGTWEPLGLADAQVWAVVLDEGHRVYAGLEPASVWCMANGTAHMLDGLDAVEGHEEWDSPWGAADLSAVVAEQGRLIVGVEVGGVAISYDGGATWSARNEGLYPDVHHLVAAGDTLVASTGMGLFCSRDEGRTWTSTDEGVDRGYALGLAISQDRVLAAVGGGPPPDDPLVWAIVYEGFAGAVERQGLDARGDVVVAGTTAGEVLVSTDRGVTFGVVRDDLAPVVAVALADSQA